jgi:hypothetical protein
MRKLRSKINKIWKPFGHLCYNSTLRDFLL